jgi:hypothetical protein
LHAIWTVITQDKQGYSRHPETKRWVGKLAALFVRHELLVAEMTKRGYNHASPLDVGLATGSNHQSEFVDPPATQLLILSAKKCECLLDAI